MLLDLWGLWQNVEDEMLLGLIRRRRRRRQKVTGTFSATNTLEVEARGRVIFRGQANAQPLQLDVQGKAVTIDRQGEAELLMLIGEEDLAVMLLEENDRRKRAGRSQQR